MKEAIKGLILLGALSLALMVKSANAKKTSERFMPKSFSAEYVQSYTSSLKGKVKKSTGNFDYLYPSRLKLASKHPQELTFVSNQFKSWLYTAPFDPEEPGELMVNPTGEKNAYGKFFDALKEGLKTNKMYKVTHAKGKSVLLSFTKSGQKDTEIKTATIFLKKGKVSFDNVESIDLVFIDGKKFNLKLKSVKKNVKFKTNHFNFVAPKGTRVIK